MLPKMANWGCPNGPEALWWSKEYIPPSFFFLAQFHSVPTILIIHTGMNWWDLDISSYWAVEFFKFLFGCAGLLCCCAWAFSSCGARASQCSSFSRCVVWATGCAGLSSCGTWAQLPLGMWDFPRPGIEPVCPALAGRFSTTGPLGKLWALEFLKM